SADDDALDCSILDSRAHEHGQREYYAHDPSNAHHHSQMVERILLISYCGAKQDLGSATQTSSSIFTSTSKPVQSPPQPRSTSIHLQESLYTSESGRTSPIGSFETHQNPSVLQVTPTVPHIASQPPFLNSAASPRQKFEPLPGTLARSNRYKTHIATKYELMQQIHKLRDTNRTSRLAVYNPLAVIRYRREMWQAAVKEKAPATDVRKLRMLRTARGSGSGWTVDDDEVREYIDAVILASTDATKRFVVEDAASKPTAAGASFAVLSTVASTIDKDTAHATVTADPIGEPMKSPRNNHTMLKGMNKLFGMGRKPGGGGDEKGKSLDGAGKLDASASNAADLNPTVSAGGILSTEIHPDDAVSRDRKDFGDDAAGHHGNNGAGRRFVNRVRTGTGALNSLLGKGHAKKRGDHHHTSSSRRGSLVSESGHHVVEDLPSSSPTKHDEEDANDEYNGDMPHRRDLKPHGSNRVTATNNPTSNTKKLSKWTAHSSGPKPSFQTDESAQPSKLDLKRILRLKRLDNVICQ
ncbi:hypothetical protein HDU80_008253, partial [Chytriomyces hyalinus]